MEGEEPVAVTLKPSNVRFAPVSAHSAEAFVAEMVQFEGVVTSPVNTTWDSLAPATEPAALNPV